MSTWEERMSARVRMGRTPGLAIRSHIAALRGRDAYVAAMFGRFYQAGDPDEILPEILAARCLGIGIGDPGPLLEPKWCRECWGERHVWLGNCWGLSHAGGTMNGCGHSCHEGEVWMG